MPPTRPALDQDEFGSNRSKFMNLIHFLCSERDRREKPVPAFSHPALALFAAASLFGLSGCAGLPHFPHWVEIKPIHRGEARAEAVDAGYYASAVAAIDRRDYAKSLDLLQAARTRTPGDVKVLNAFGVVYDKLGRFDLSARYYAQAKTLDAASPILAANLAYSAELRQRAEAPQLAAIAPPAVTTLAMAPAQPLPGVIRLGFASPGTSIQTLPLLTGRTLRIANASGRPDGAEPTRAQLASLGWSAPKAGVKMVASEPRTTITYAAQNAVAAQGLAHTLPRGVQLVSCQDACQGIRLTLGADALAWRLPPARRTTGSGD